MMNRYAAAVWLGFFLASASAVAQNAAAPAAAKPAAPVASTEKATYVGSEVCMSCHEDIGKAFAKNPHEAVETGSVKKYGFKGQACESCHGPGSNHITSLSPADIRNPAKLPAAETDKTCLTCHRNEPTQAGRLESSHAHNQVACTGCHTIHGSTDALVARKPAQVNALCASCHETEMAAFQLPFKHRVVEGAMTCVDCHNPHGSFKPGMMQLTMANEPGCLKCHVDKRGPFTYEHQPVRTEGCGSCHEPHGSANAKMLIRTEVRYMCLECHANLPAQSNSNLAVAGVVPPASHDMVSPRYRNCTICHQKIHGSQIDRNLLR
jgi:DmsE family decaheme c-type cytochrome